MSVVSRLEDGVYDHAIDLTLFEEGVKRRAIGFLKEMTDDINQLLADSPTVFQEQRLTALLNQVENTISDAHRLAKTDMRNQMLEFAPIEEKATTKIMNDSLQANLFSPTMTQGQLNAVVDDSLIRGALASDWWDRLESNTKNKIVKGIQLGIAEGETLGQIKRRLLGKTTGEFETYESGGKTKRRMKRVGGWIQTSNREAEALIRTSVHSVASNVRDQTYKNNRDVIDQVESVATLDGRTTPLCVSYDGLRWTADGHKPVGGHGKAYLPTPRHWNCRSTHVPVIGMLDKLDNIAKNKGIKIPPATRASVKGKVPDLTKMDDWLIAQPKATQNKLLGGVAKGELFRKGKGKFKVKDFTGRRGDPLNIEDLRKKFNVIKDAPEPITKGVGEKISKFGRHKDSNDLLIAGDKWARNNTEDQKKAVAGFTVGEYKKMRAFMRGNLEEKYKREFSADEIADIKKQVKDFKTAVQNAPEYEGNVFRGVSYDNEKTRKTLNKLRRLKTITMPADSSATRSVRQANRFLESPPLPVGRENPSFRPLNIVYWFNQRTGKSIERASKFKFEQEVIIQQKTRFDLVKIYEKKDINKMIDEKGGSTQLKNVRKENLEKADYIIELEEI